jgi:hypothetical protein
VLTASTAHFTPCGIADFIRVLLVKVGITEMGGSREAFLATRLGFGLFDIRL